MHDNRYRVIEGVAATYEVTNLGGGVWQRFAPPVFDVLLRENPCVPLRVGGHVTQPGRTIGTTHDGGLELWTDPRGLCFRARVAAFELRGLGEDLERGRLRASVCWKPTARGKADRRRGGLVVENRIAELCDVLLTAAPKDERTSCRYSWPAKPGRTVQRLL